jgi:hypothetical protein
MSEEPELLDELHEKATIIAVATVATLMAIGIKEGLSPNLVLATLEVAGKKESIPITRKGYELILGNVLKTFADLSSPNE